MTKILRVLVLILLLTLMATPIFAQSQVPTLTGVVSDYTQTLSAGEIQEIEQHGQQIVVQSANKLHKIYVLLTPNLYGYSDSNEFGRQVFDANRLGTGDVLITIELDTHALVVTNSSELDQDFLKNAPSCKGDWGTYVVNDVIPGYLRSGDFRGGIVAGMQEVGRIVTQTPTDCSVAAVPVQPVQSVQSASTGPDVGVFLIVCVLAIIVILLILFLIGWSESGGYVSTSGGGYSSSGNSYSWPTSSPSSPGGWSPASSRGSSSRSGGSSSGSSSSRSSFGSGGSSSRSSSGSGGSSSRSSSSSSSSRSGKW